MVLGLLVGCRPGAQDISTTRSQVAPLDPTGLQEQSTRIATAQDRYTQLQHRLEQGRYGDVARNAEQAYKDTVASDRLLAWKFRILQAKATLRKNDPEGALALLKMEQPSGLSIEDLARKEFVSADAKIVLRKPNEALVTLNQIKLMMPSASTDPILNAEWLILRGKCEPRGPESAQAYFSQAAGLAHARSKYLESAAEVQIGNGFFQKQHFDEAIDHFKTAFSLAKEADSPVMQEIVLGGFAQAYFELGDYTKAEQYAHNAERIAADLGLADHHMRQLINVGRNQQERGKYAEAMDIFQQVLALAQKDSNKKNSTEKEISNDITERCLRNMADMDMIQGNLDKVEAYVRQAADLGLEGETALSWQVTRIDLALNRHDSTSADNMLTSLLAERSISPKLRGLLQERKARLYELLQKTNDADQWYRKALDTALERSKAFNRQEYKISFLSNFPFYNNYIEFLIRTNQANRALQVAEIGRAKVLAKASAYNPASDNTTAWLGKIQGELKSSNKVILAYWVSQSRLYTWIITPSEIQIVQQPHGGRELTRLVESYQQEIDLHNKIEECPAAAGLYKLLVQPVEAYLPKNSHAIIVADSILYDINFESLIVSRPKLHYWIEDVELENAISVQQVTTTSRRQPNYEKELLAIGAPIQVSPEFSLLPHAPDEIKLVTSTFAPEQQRVITREQATPQAFFNSSPGSYRYIHFVAHGTKAMLEPLDSAIILSPDETHSYKLYARDIANLKRPLRAQVVTISSCDSAGVSSNEMGGPFGLSWAFTHAGAKQVVAALWKVDDATMPQLMGAFYNGMAQGKPTSRALHDAKLSFLHSRSARKTPYYWATLQLYSGS